MKDVFYTEESEPCMRLNKDEILNITYGACFARQSETGLVFERFSDEQKPIFKKPEKYYGDDPFFFDYFVQNCRTDSCIMLDFITDSKSVELVIGAIESVNGSIDNRITVLKNGRLTAQIEEPGNYLLRSGGKETRFTVYFPYFGETALKDIITDDGCTVKPAKPRKLWLMYGDSITHGVGASSSAGSYAGRTSYMFNGEVINQGNSGYVHDTRTIKPIYDLRSGEVRTPELITSAYGINDHGRKQYEDNYSDTFRYFSELKKMYPGTRIVMISPIWAAFFDGKDNEYEDMCGLYREIGVKLGIEMIEGSALVPHDGKYFVDGVHPNDRGYAYYASRLIRKLELS